MKLSPILLVAATLFLAPVSRATDQVQFDYMMTCQGCHLPQGQGFPLRDVPSINGYLGKFLHVAGGREFLVQVPGSAQSDLDSERLAAVINWMLFIFSPDELPEDFQPYTAAEVSQLRKTPLVDVKGTRAALVEKIQQTQVTAGK